MVGAFHQQPAPLVQIRNHYDWWIAKQMVAEARNMLPLTLPPAASGILSSCRGLLPNHAVFHRLVLARVLQYTCKLQMQLNMLDSPV